MHIYYFTVLKAVQGLGSHVAAVGENSLSAFCCL
jgi:hypothetical protein